MFVFSSFKLSGAGHVVLLPLRIEVTRVGFLVQLVCKDSRKLVAISIKPESLILAKHIHFLFFQPLNNR